CPECAGTGAKPGTAPVQCGTCGGTGEVRRQAQSLFGQFLTVSPCPTCGGEGTIVHDPCSRCGGDGRVKAEKTIQIDVHAGVAYRLRAKGLPRLGEGGHGDLHVRVHVWTPNKLTAEQKKLLEKLRDVEDTPPLKEEGGRFWDTVRKVLGGGGGHE